MNTSTEATVTAPSMTYQPALDGLRAIAVLLVLNQHLLAFVAPKIGLPPGGYTGVDVFFVLSGFLITSLLLAEHTRHGAVSYRSFYRRRIARLVPALVLLLAVQVTAAIVAGQSLSDELRLLVGAGTYTTNWVMAAGWRVPANTGHLWSLAVEEQFYIVWPVVLVLVVRRWGLRTLPYVAGAGVAIALASRVFVAEHLGAYPIAYLHTEARIDGLLLGALLAWARHTGVRLPAWLVRAAAWLGLAALAGFVLRSGPADPWLYSQGGYTLLAVACLAIVAGALEPTWLPRQVLASRPLVWIGQRSYGLYLWNLPLCFLVAPALDGRSPAVQATAVAGATFAFAAASYRWLERPARAAIIGSGEPARRRSWDIDSVLRRTRRIAPALACCGTLMVAGVASASVGHDAIQKRDAAFAAAAEARRAPVTAAAAPAPPAPGVEAPVESTEPAAAGDSGDATGGGGAATASVPSLVPTELTVAPAHVRIDGQTPVLDLAAHLARADTSAPLPGRVITLSSGSARCDATTNAAGDAACSVPASAVTSVPSVPASVPATTTVDQLAVSASYAGDSTTAPAHATSA